MGMCLKTLEGIIAVFDSKVLQSAVSVYSCLIRNGFGIADLIDHLKKIKERNDTLQRAGVIDRKRRAKKARKAWEAIALPCPECTAPLFVKHICKKKGPENVHGYTCLWFCENGDCTYEKYTYENAGEETKKLMEGRKE